MLVNILPEQAGKTLSDNGSYPALTAGQKASLIDGAENSGGITFGGTSYGPNIVTGGAATASDYYNAAYDASKAADGNTGTWWETLNANPPHWWTYQFAAAKAVTKLTIQCGHIYGLKNFTLDGSNDNTSWTTVYTGQAAQVTTVQTFIFANTTAYPYYRINGSDVWVAANSFRIQEFQMFESIAGSLNFKLDITGIGACPVSEVHYFTTETDTSKVTIKTSADNASWTARATVAGGSGYLKAAVGAAARYVTIDHAPPAQQTSYEIEVLTQRCIRPLAGSYHVLSASARWAAANYNVVCSRTASKFAASFYSVRQPASKSAAARYHNLQPSARSARAFYHLLRTAAKHLDARYHIRHTAPALLTVNDAAAPAIVAGLLRTGAASAELSFHLWNCRGDGNGLRFGNIRITTTLDGGQYGGGAYPLGREVVEGKWVELKSAGALGAGIADDAQTLFTPVGGDPALNGLSVGDIPANAGRVIAMRINVPAAPATSFSASPRLDIAYDVFADPGFGANYGGYFGG